MRYTLIVTPQNIKSRLSAGALLIFAGLLLMALLDHIERRPRLELLAATLLFVGPIVTFFALRWLWRLLIVAWFK
jgi:hypothetical protein